MFLAFNHSLIPVKRIMQIYNFEEEDGTFTIEVEFSNFEKSLILAERFATKLEMINRWCEIIRTLNKS